MWIRQLRIENFRGLAKACIDFSERQTVLVGANGAGKSTVIEALALLLGKDRLVRTLTEHDFYGSNPQPQDRMRFVATISGFGSNKPSDYGEWFSAGRGVPKWIDRSSGKVVSQPKSADDALCVQIGFCARFDQTELEVETIRYFHDDDSVCDPFDDDLVQTIPKRLIAELGFFLVPAHRAWDRLVSFSSELFRRTLESSGTLPATEVLSERDRLRSDQHRVDLSGSLGALRTDITTELGRLLPGQPGFELRLTSTDTDSLLQCLVPHYRYGGSVSLPAGRHGSGLLSLQTALLILLIAERRHKASANVIVAMEEPELHMPPGVQAHILQRLRSASDQLVCSTHSPRVAAVCSATDVRVLYPRNGFAMPVAPLLTTALPLTAKNGVRKLFNDNRQAYIEAIMNRFVLVPEGRTDVEWLRLLATCTLSDEFECPEAALLFNASFGVAPTHDCCVVDTVEHIKKVRGDVLALVDGDPAGDGYISDLLQMACPPDHIAQWPKGWEIEDVIGWVCRGDADLVESIRAELNDAPSTLAGLVEWLKTPTNKGGAKGNYVAYETIAGCMLSSPEPRNRARRLLGAFIELMNRTSSGLVAADARSTKTCPVWRFTIEP